MGGQQNVQHIWGRNPTSKYERTEKKAFLCWASDDRWRKIKYLEKNVDLSPVGVGLIIVNIVTVLWSTMVWLMPVLKPVNHLQLHFSWCVITRWYDDMDLTKTDKADIDVSDDEPKLNFPQNRSGYRKFLTFGPGKFSNLIRSRPLAPRQVDRFSAPHTSCLFSGSPGLKSANKFPRILSTVQTFNWENKNYFHKSYFRRENWGYGKRYWCLCHQIFVQLKVSEKTFNSTKSTTRC